MKKGIIKPVLIGGAAYGILSALPYVGMINCCCCVLAIGGGVLATMLHVREAPERVTMGRGALIGLAAGIVGAVIYAMLSLPLQLFAVSGIGSEEFMSYIQQQMADMPSDVPPETRQAMQDMVELLQRKDFPMLAVIIGTIINFICFSLFAMLGGAIGVAIFEKRKATIATPDIASEMDIKRKD